MAKRGHEGTTVVQFALISPLRVLCDALASAVAKSQGVRIVTHALSVEQVAKRTDLIVVFDASSAVGLRLLRAASRRLAIGESSSSD
jgi:hypothetical protein